MAEPWVDNQSQFATTGTITLIDRVSIYKYGEYLNRMRGSNGASPNMNEFRRGGDPQNWDWPGSTTVSSSMSLFKRRLPRLTNGSEFLGYKNSGDTIEIVSVLWQGIDDVFGRGHFQAVELDYNGTRAFAWVVYDNKLYFTQQQAQPEPEQPQPPVLLVFDTNIALNGLPTSSSRFHLIMPTFIVKINVNPASIPANEKFRLYTTEIFPHNQQRIFDETKTAAQRETSNTEQVEFLFQRNGQRYVPYNGTFNLEIDPGPDEQGRARDPIKFDDLPFCGRADNIVNAANYQS